jgi:Domain of unknown function (DUF4326)
MIQVIKKGQGRGEYIGRGSPLGNPYSHLERSTAEVHVSTREASIAAFDEYLGLMLESRSSGEVSDLVAAHWQHLERSTPIEPRRAAITGELERLLGIARAGDLNLMCFCAPLPCHGHTIQAHLETRLDGGEPPALEGEPSKLPLEQAALDESVSGQIRSVVAKDRSEPMDERRRCNPQRSSRLVAKQRGAVRE